MELSNAIKDIIDRFGTKVLPTRQFVNLLDDVGGFKDEPTASKKVMKGLLIVVSESFYDNQLPLGDAPHNYLSEMFMKLGFRQDVSAFVLNSILDALGYGTPITVASNDLGNDLVVPTFPEDSPIIPNSGNHFEFKGVTINGSKDDVADSLQKQGYEFVDGGEDGILLNGKFAGIDNCQILVNASQHNHQTYSISVFTPEALTWWSVKADYDRIKEMLRKNMEGQALLRSSSVILIMKEMVTNSLR